MGGCSIKVTPGAGIHFARLVGITSIICQLPPARPQSPFPSASDNGAEPVSRFKSRRLPTDVPSQYIRRQWNCTAEKTQWLPDPRLQQCPRDAQQHPKQRGNMSQEPAILAAREKSSATASRPLARSAAQRGRNALTGQRMIRGSKQRPSLPYPPPRSR